MAKQSTGKKNNFKKRALIILGLAVFWLLLEWFTGYPNAVERFYSNGFYLLVCYVFHPVFNLLPFSAGDILYTGIVIYLVYLTVKLIRLLLKKQWKPAGFLMLGVVLGVQIASISFYLLWGLNYYRPSAAERLNLRDSDYTVADLKAVTSILIDSANACRKRLSEADLKQGNDAINGTAINAVKHMQDNHAAFRTFHPDIKPALLTPLIDYLGTSGYYNPFTAESQINYHMPVFLRPFVACHELSHQMGFAPEDEANFVGFLAGTQSHDKLLRYSAYYEGVQEFMYTLRRQDSIGRKELRTHILPEVLSDFKTERTYWLAYEGKLEKISGLFYDNFLKANNQPYGLRTYNRMVLLILAYRKQHPL